MIGKVGAAFDRGVVGDDQDFATRDAADAGDEAGARRFVVVHLEGGERRQLEERRAAVEQALDALAHRQLALRAMPLDVFRAAAFARAGEVRAQIADELLHPIAIGLEERIGGIDVLMSRTTITSRSSRS